MTDQGPETDPVEPTPDGVAAEPQTDFTSGEGLVAMAGIVLLLVWLIFEIIASEYFISNLGVMLAITAALVPRLDQSDVEKVHRRAVIMKVVGYALVLNGVIEIVDDVRFDAYDSVMAVIGALAAYAAYAMAFFGARSIKT